MSSNLPPGVTDSMIPGNRPEDTLWEQLCDDICGSGLTIEEAQLAWKIGMAVMKECVSFAIDQAYLEGCKEGLWKEKEEAA